METERKIIAFEILGHIVHTKSLERIINEMDSTGANVCAMEMSMPSHEGESAAIVKIEGNEEQLEKCGKLVEKLCENDGLVLLREI